MVIQAVVKGEESMYEGLLEPTYSSNFPKHLFIARSVGTDICRGVPFQQAQDPALEKVIKLLAQKKPMLGLA